MIQSVRFFKPLFFVILAFSFLGLLGARNAQAIDIQEVVTPGGIKLWLVEDYTVPILALSAEFNGGSSQDPADQQGLTQVMSSMMDEGAGDLDTAALKAELEERAIDMTFSADSDATGLGMRILVAEADRAFELLGSVLTSPRFDPVSLERLRASYVAASKSELTSPQAILGKQMRTKMFATHPYSYNGRGDEMSIKSITRDDIVAQQKRLMVKDRLSIGVVGAINAKDLAVLVDKAFGGLPATSVLKVVEEIKPNFGFREHIEFDAPQTIVSITLPAPKRNDPDFFAAFLMNHILGGGTFSSRLYSKVREERGLAYSVGSSLAPSDHTAYIAVGFATKPDQANEALDLTLAEIRRLVTDGPSADELELAKKYVLGSYAINNLDTSSKIANVLVGLQTEKLGIDYISTREQQINSVTLDDIKAVLQKYLAVEPNIMTIGPAKS